MSLRDRKGGVLKHDRKRADYQLLFEVQVSPAFKDLSFSFSLDGRGVLRSSSTPQPLKSIVTDLKLQLGRSDRSEAAQPSLAPACLRI